MASLPAIGLGLLLGGPLGALGAGLATRKGKKKVPGAAPGPAALGEGDAVLPGETLDNKMPDLPQLTGALGGILGGGRRKKQPIVPARSTQPVARLY